MKALSICGIVLSGLAIFAILNATAQLEAALGAVESGELTEFGDSVYGGLGMGLVGALFGLAQSAIGLVVAADRRRRTHGGSR